MKTLLLTYFLTFSIAFSVYSQTTKKVLFIGNSYTFYNDLPTMVSNMAETTGDVLIHDSSTPGGFRFVHHASHTSTLDKINSNDWNYVVLQAQSQETSFSQSHMEENLYPYAEILIDSIRTNNECSEPMLYMTWGRKNGDSNRCAAIPWVCTYEDMDDAVKETYLLMANNYKTELSPVGAVWRYIRTNNPFIELYDPDSSHPSLTGSYLAACTFYTMIYKKDPTLINWNSSLSDENANIIKAAAKTIVYNQLSNWDFTINPSTADYSETITENEISFTNTSSNYDSLIWDFGDSNTSTQSNPTHTYTSNGSFTVTLTTIKCGKTDTKTKTLTIDSSLHLEKIGLKTSVISPNPISDYINIDLNKFYSDIEILIFDISGKIITKKSFQSATTLNINTKKLSKGVYILKIITDKDSYSRRILKK